MRSIAKFINIFRRILLIILLLFISLTYNGCKDKGNDNPPKPDSKLTIYAVTDLHGAIEEENAKYGIARLAEYITSNKVTKPAETVVVSAGDMFQGTAISNYSRGKDVINMMNLIGFDAMTIGNHEFDWYLDTVLAYRDEDESNGEANFPFLGANIKQISTNGIPQDVEPYTIIEKNNLKIGIIGYVAYGAESDIQASQVEDYEFLNPTPIVKEYVKELRTEKDVDIVIVSAHDGSSSGVNKTLASYTGDYRVDAIINGHSHVNASGVLYDENNRKVPYVQAGCNGEYVGTIDLTIDNEKVEVKEAVAKTINMSSNKPKNTEIVNYVTELKKITDPLFSEVLGIAGCDINRYQGADWAATSLMLYANCDIGVINIGGIRATAFPIYAQEAVTISKIFAIMPFENCLKIVTLKGVDLYTIVQKNDLIFSKNCTYDGTTFSINGVIVDENQEYNVATIDYVYDNEKYPFLSIGSKKVISTKTLFRDILITSLRETCKDGSKWNG